MYIIVWAMLVLYAWLLAPGASAGNDLLFKNLITGNFQLVDPLVVMVFSFLGLFPVLFMVMICKKDTYNCLDGHFLFYHLRLELFLFCSIIIGKDKKFEHVRVFLHVSLLSFLLIYGLDYA
ncbi:hypothetical protein [Priestia megaterium]